MRIERGASGARILAAARLIGINLVVLAVLSTGIEGCVRATHPEIKPLGTDSGLFADSVFGDYPGPRPGASGLSNGARFQAGSHGFWDYENPPASISSAWLFLGDSVTMGIGIEREGRFAGIIADHLNETVVLNPSIVGYSSRDYLNLLRVLLASEAYGELGIDRVTVFWCLNDIYAVSRDRKDPDHNFRRLAGPLLRFVHRNVYTYQWLKAVLFDRPRRYFEHDVRLYTESNVSAAAAHLRGISNLCSEYSLRCEVVLLPYEYQLRTHSDSSVFLPQRLLRAQLRGSGIRVYDPSEYLLSRGGDSTDLFLYGDGIHFSEEGHRRLAEYLIGL